MTFTVDARGLQGLPAQLDRLSEDASQGRTYVIGNAKISYGGILDKISGSHEQAITSAADFFDRVAHPVAQTSAAAVRASIKYYQQSDHHAAARLDATYPTAGEPKAGEGAKTGAGFSDVSEPQDRYRAIADYSGEFPLEPRQLITLSMTGFARNLIIEATDLAAKLGFGHHWDPYEAILKPLTGDWAGLRGCADVFDNAAEALEDMSRNVRNGVLSVPGVWEGNAADSATHHLDEIAEALEAAAQPFKDIGLSFDKASEAAHELFGALADLVSSLVDAVIIFISEATAAVATSETVVGGLAFGAAAGYEAYEVYELIRGLIECFSTANAIYETLMSGYHVFQQVDGSIKLPELPDDRPTLPGNQGGVYAPSISAAPVDRSRVPDPGVRPTLGQVPDPGVRPTTGPMTTPAPPPGGVVPQPGGRPAPAPQPAPTR